MKPKKLFLLAVISVMIACDKNDETRIAPLNPISACGTDDPLNQLDWLHDLAWAAIDDESGNYLGSIWVISYDLKNFVVTDMALGGATMYHFFDCQGNTPTLNEVPPLEEREMYLLDTNILFSTTSD